MIDKGIVNVKSVGLVEVEKELTKQERKLAAEWIVAEKLLEDLLTPSCTRETWESMKDDYLQGKVSFETWERYYNENPIDPILESEANKVKKAKRELIELPGNGILISEYSQQLVDTLKDKSVLFYRQDSRQVVELGIVKNSKGEVTHTGFIPIKSSRFITLVEIYFKPWNWVYSKSGSKFQVFRSMIKDVGNTVLDSQIFHDDLPNISRIFTVQLPVMYEGELTFPKEQYDERFNSWLPYNSPVIENLKMPLEEAKELIYNVFKEFCFETSQDYTNAISALLTPYLRGLFRTGFNTRCPIYCYEANRERSGKDYLAGITGILYEGHALEEPPISSGEYRASGGNDELRKKIISAMISGRKRLHFSNNKGHLNNSVLEAVSTAERYSDRLLGKNESVTFDNELDFSFSGNIGITLTPDLANRTIFIKLFLDIEDANKRKFDTPDLHKQVLEERNQLLSALYSLVKNWFDNGCPDGSIPFASFPEWARVCGGIMEAAGYDSPCKTNKEEMGISIDSETDEMKELFEICYQERKGEWLTKDDIKNIILGPSGNIMNYMEWESRSAQTKFGIKLNKFVGRILSDIRLVVEDRSVRSSRWKYKFSKNEQKIDKDKIFKRKVGNLGNDGNLIPTAKLPIYNREYKRGPQVAKDTKVTKAKESEKSKEVNKND